MSEKSQIFNWILGPADVCIRSIGEGTVMAGFLIRAIAAASCQGPFLNLARQQLGRLPNSGSLDAIDRLISEQDWIVSEAKKIADADYHPLHVNGVISLWSAVEVAVEDTVVICLMNDQQAVQTAFATSRKEAEAIDGLLTENDARRIYDRMSRQARSDEGIIGNYKALLLTFGISLNFSKDVAIILCELNYVRNCLLHRGGIVDSRVFGEAPALEASPGERLKIGRERYDRYYDAAAKFATSLLGGVLASRYMKSKA